MPLVPINITGQQYQSRSGQLSNQVTQNFYAELTQDPFGKAKYVLQPTPGMLLFGSAGSGDNRGLFEHLGVLYHVSGGTLFTVSQTGAHTSRGTISGVDQVIFTPLGSNIIIVANAGANIYQWNGTTLSAITDGDLETPQSATTLNNQVIYQGDNGRFCTSDVGDATSINALNYATAESAADDLVRVFAFNQKLYLFGQKTIEVWWNSGQGNPPFDRVEGAIMQVGLDAKHSVAVNDHRMYWLGDDDQVYMLMEGAAQQAVSNIAMHSKISGYTWTSDAIGFCFTFEGQEFYMLSFPTEDKSWLFNEDTGWTTMSSGTSGGRSLANRCVRAFGKLIVADYDTGNLYEWSAGWYMENYDVITRIRDTAPLHGGLFGAPGSRIEQNDLRLIMEVGTGSNQAYINLPDDDMRATTPDAAPFGVTGDIELQFRFSADDWASGVDQHVLGKSSSGSDISYQLVLSNVGALHLRTSPDGTSVVSNVGLAAWTPGLASGEYFDGKITLDVDDGAGNRVYKLYTLSATNEYVLTDTQTIAGTTSIYDSTSNIEIGTRYESTSRSLTGTVSYVRVYDGIDGTQVINFDAGDWVSGTTFTASTTGELWTVLNDAGMVVAADNPSITLSISDDGGNTFSTEVEADIGAESDFLREVRWNALGSFVDGRILRIKTTDRVFTSIHGASSYIEIGI